MNRAVACEKLIVTEPAGCDYLLHVATTEAYWFNDADYHGVLADPFFRYSFRVDGTFTPEFVAGLERAERTAAP